MKWKPWKKQRVYPRMEIAGPPILIDHVFERDDVGRIEDRIVSSRCGVCGFVANGETSPMAVYNHECKGSK